MISADSSSLVAFFNGEKGSDVEQIAQALASGNLTLPPAVLTEMFSDPGISPIVDREIRGVALLAVLDGFWLRAGEARRLLLQHGLKAKVGDALIAQSCIDHDVALITRDGDFRHFAKHCGLKLA